MGWSRWAPHVVDGPMPHGTRYLIASHSELWTAYHSNTATNFGHLFMDELFPLWVLRTILGLDALRLQPLRVSVHPPQPVAIFRRSRFPMEKIFLV